MESPAGERLRVEEYLRSQSGEDFRIIHVEKVTQEYAIGREFDVWDAHTNEGRWWVITNPMNLYSQETIKSMNVALSFHIGLTSRILSQVAEPRSGGPNDWALEGMRRLSIAHERLDHAKEIEDFQAVGMRLREALVSIAIGVASLLPELEERPKASDFKAWAKIAAERFAAGSSSEHLRGLLKSSSEKTWAYVNWLTHARKATPLDAQIACSATSDYVSMLVMSIARWRAGDPPRCFACGSYQLVIELDEDDELIRLCSVCKASDVVEQAEAQEPPDAESPQSSQPPEGDCDILDEFEVYVTPEQARTSLEEAGNQMEEEPQWTNRYAITVDNGFIFDVHRVAFSVAGKTTDGGSELVYQCGQDSCISPEHALHQVLPDIGDWRAGVILRVRYSPDFLELVVGLGGGKEEQIKIGHDVMELYGIGDASAFLERIMIYSSPSPDGVVHALLSSYRYDYSRPSIFLGNLLEASLDNTKGPEGQTHVD